MNVCKHIYNPLRNNTNPIGAIPHPLIRYSAIDNERHDADHYTVDVMSLFIIPKSSAKRKTPRLK